MPFTPRTSRFNVAVILALLTAGFGLAYATVPVAGVSSGILLSPTGYVDTADARSLPNVPPVSQNISAHGSNGGDDGSINTHIHAKDHDSSFAAFTFPGGILAAIPNVPPVSQNISAPGLNDAAITFACCAYNPTVVTITVGASVSWSGNFAFPHPLRQVDGPTSDVPVPGGFANSTGTFYSVQFNTPGTFYYQCAFHGLAQFGGTMRGKIVVLRPPVFLFLPLVGHWDSP